MRRCTKECLGIAENKLCGENIIVFLYLHVWIILKHASCLRGSLKLERIESRYTRKCTQLRLTSFFPVQYVFVISYKMFWVTMFKYHVSLALSFVLHGSLPFMVYMEPCVAMVLFSMVGKSSLCYFLPTRALVNNRIWNGYTYMR